MYYVYLLKLSNNDIYTGSCKDIKKRFEGHVEGSVFSTKPFRPVKLIYYCALPTKTQAIKFEMYLKTGSGKAFRNKHLFQPQNLYNPEATRTSQFKLIYYNNMSDLIQKIELLSEGKERFLIAIDGRGGSGEKYTCKLFSKQTQMEEL